MNEPVNFTVVIPTYNRAHHVAPCLAPFLEPGAAGIEVIVVDDGSSDGTEAEVAAAAERSRGAEIRYAWQANAGPGAARNRGARMARSDWIVFQDIDDRWFPWSIAVVRKALAAADGAALLFLRTWSFAEDADLANAEPAEIVLAEHPDYYAFDMKRPVPHIGTGSVGVPRAVLTDVGGLEERIRCGEDLDFFYRVADKGRVVTVVEPPVVGIRTYSGDSLTANPVFMREGMDFLLERLEAGRFPEPQETVAYALARSRRIWSLNYFARGQMEAGYSLILPPWRFLIRQWGLVLYLKTVLTPFLTLVRPSHYHFNWAAWRARRRESRAG
jgi:glycosyltransferase involved in cell wall biosynthesis